MAIHAACVWHAKPMLFRDRGCMASVGMLPSKLVPDAVCNSTSGALLQALHTALPH